MKEYYSDDAVTIYHGDAFDVLPHVAADVLVTDPPYGINWQPRVNNRDGRWVDDERPDLAPFIAATNSHCVWGGNYFTDTLPPSEAWLVWIKRPAGFDFDNDGRSYSVIEMAWTDFGGKPRMKHHVWDGGMRAGDSSNRSFCHPAQKPLEVMRWAVSLAPDGVVLDPFMGSGTTLRAAKDLNRKAIGIELDERYCEIAAKRMAQEVLAL